VGKKFEKYKNAREWGSGCGPTLDVDGMLPLVRYNEVKKPTGKKPLVGAEEEMGERSRKSI
jgi:hypothetical protein